MMNLVALSLIATSLAVSGLFSLNPVANERGEQVIVKDGHRAVVVEYADTTGDGNTKVLISPPNPTKGLEEIDEGLSRATASVAGVAQDVKGKAKEAVHGGPRELICDAYGKCKHKVAGVLGRAKERAGKAEETVEEVVEEAVDKAKGFASKATGEVEEVSESVRDSAKEKVRDAKQKVYNAKEKVEEIGETVRDSAKEKVNDAKEKVYNVKEKVKETGEKTGEKVREAGEKVKEKTEEVVEEVKEKGRKGKKELSDIAKRCKEVIADVIGYVFGVDSIGNLMNLMGFAIAYGTGVWVTFVMNYVLAGVLPRQQFAMVQSKMYPVYFKAMVGSIGLALLGHLLGHRSKVFKSMPEVLQSSNLLSSLGMVLANLLFLEPRATKVVFEKMRLEKEEGRGRDRNGVATTRVIDTVVTDSAGPVPTGDTTTTAAAISTPTRRVDDQAKIKLARIDEKLKKLNSYSSLLNIMMMMGLTWHLVYLSQRLGVIS